MWAKCPRKTPREKHSIFHTYTLHSILGVPKSVLDTHILHAAGKSLLIASVFSARQ
jgi:hypothetical protein